MTIKFSLFNTHYTLFHYRYIRTVYLFYLQTETHNIIIKAYKDMILVSSELSMKK